MKETILIVDDNLTNIQLAASLLVHMDHELVFATSAAEAFSILKEQEIDLMLLDLMMPEMDGFEACLHLREAGYSLPIIFLTAQNDSSSIVKAFESGGNDYVFKPFNSLELIARVENQLALKRMRDKLSLEVEKEVKKKREMEHLLVESSKMAQMGEMFSMITHQWKQPLNAITLACTNAEIKMELGTYNTDESLGLLQDITSYANHLAGTISDFKSFFKPTKEFTLLYVSDIIQKALTLNKERLALSEVSVVFNSDDAIQVSSIENEIIQVLLILFQNSLDAFEEGFIVNPKIEIELLDDIDSVKIEIKDNAGGIEDEHIESIFNANFTTKGDDGSGIGLYMCYLMIHQHCKGEISVANIDGGACFSISLPKKL
jgi:C4-dicarboxylate-specific signal transduction histidine kinase